MTALSGLFKLASAYALTQVLTGVEMGVLIGVGVAFFGWAPSTVAAVLPFGLVLVVVQYVLLLRTPLFRLSGGGALRDGPQVDDRDEQRPALPR